MANKNKIAIAGIAISVIGLLFAALACGLESWATISFFGEDLYVGLWKYCISSVCVNIDSDIVSDTILRSFKAVRAMTLLGILFSAAAIVCGFLTTFKYKKMKTLYFLASGISFLAGLTMMIALAVAVDRVKPSYPDYFYGAAFYLDIASWIVMWVAAVVFIVAKNKDKNTIQT